MTPIFVSGLINQELSVPIGTFPIPYQPVQYHFGEIGLTVSGVGFNVAMGLNALGSRVRLASMVGNDLSGQMVRQAVQAAGFEERFVVQTLQGTARSVVLYDENGRRRIHTDLQDIQERPYPPEQFAAALEGCETAVLTNINFNRPFLQSTKRAGKRIATDIHAISRLDDEYNREFMAAADILFMSHENLPTTPEAWVQQLQSRYGTPIVCIGLGKAGVLLAVRADRFVERITAVYTRPVVNTVGAGDALFAAFVHFYHKTADPYLAINYAIRFASYKIGESGGANGFVDEATLLTMEATDLTP